MDKPSNAQNLTVFDPPKKIDFRHSCLGEKRVEERESPESGRQTTAIRFTKRPSEGSKKRAESDQQAKFEQPNWPTRFQMVFVAEKWPWATTGRTLCSEWTMMSVFNSGTTKCC